MLAWSQDMVTTTQLFPLHVCPHLCRAVRSVAFPFLAGWSLGFVHLIFPQQLLRHRHRCASMLMVGKGGLSARRLLLPWCQCWHGNPLIKIT